MFIADLMPKLPGYEIRVDRVRYSGDRRLAVVELTETVEVEGLPHPTPEVLVFDLDGDPEQAVFGESRSSSRPSASSPGLP